MRQVRPGNIQAARARISRARGGMTRAPFFRPLALAAALAALGAAGPAHAMSDWQRECQRGTYEINPYTPCAQPFHEGLAAVMTGSEEDEAGRWGYIDKQGRMAIAPAFQEATPFQNRLAAVRQDDLWGYIDAKGAWAIRPAYAEATGFNAQGTALVRIDERDVLIDRQGQTVKTLPLGARSWGFRRTDAGRDRGAAAAAPVQRRHGPRADAAGRRHGAGRADAGPDPRATARLALQRLVGTAERQWPLGRAAGNAALRRGAAARRQRHRRAPRRALAVRGPAGPTAVEATLWRSRRAACAGRMAGQAGTQRSGDTAGRRPPADAQLQAGLCLAGKARRLDGAARRRSDPAGRSRRPAQHPVPAARPRGHPERSRLGLCPDLGRRHRCDDRRGDGRGG